MSIVTVAAMGSDAATDLDGRRLRREQNREAVLEALAALYAEGNYEPSAAEIATRAGLSQRSLFRYFDDVDDLNRSAIERQQEMARPLVEPDVAPDAPTAEKIERVVASRMALFDAIEPAARAARVCSYRHPIVAAQVRDSRAFLRRQVERLFAPELKRAAPSALAAIDALLSFETHQLMRHDQGLSRPKTHAALVAGLTALLNPPTGGNR